MNEEAMLEIVNALSLQTIPAGYFVFEYGSLGDQFFLILDGKVEIQIPYKQTIKRYEQVKFDLETKIESVFSSLTDIAQIEEYSKKCEEEKAEIDAAEARKSVFRAERRFTKLISMDIPKATFERQMKVFNLSNEIDRLCKIKNYELMIPVNIYGPGKAFGELALTKDINAPNRLIPRAASIVCLTDCTFAVMKKADYQQILDQIERKTLDRIKAFFG